MALPDNTAAMPANQAVRRSSQAVNPRIQPMHPYSLTRRQTLGLMAAPALPLSSTAQSAWCPSQTIHYGIGVVAGGSVDLYARGIQQALEQLNLVHGQTVMADNRPGAAGLLVLQQLMRQRGNAHHLATFHTGSLAGQATGMLKADMRDYVPVAMLVEETSLVAVTAQSPLHTAQSLVSMLLRDPTSLKIAVAPLKGMNTHLAIAKPLKVAGVDVGRLTVVPFRSSADSVAALLGRHVDVVSATGPALVPLAQAGKLRLLASAAATRGTGPLAGVPTWRQQGVAADYLSYNGVLLPPGVDAEQIRFWETALQRVSQSPGWTSLVAQTGNKAIFKGYVDSHHYLQNALRSTQALVAELGLDAA